MTRDGTVGRPGRIRELIVEGREGWQGKVSSMLIGRHRRLGLAGLLISPPLEVLCVAVAFRAACHSIHVRGNSWMVHAWVANLSGGI